MFYVSNWQKRCLQKKESNSNTKIIQMSLNVWLTTFFCGQYIREREKERERKIQCVYTRKVSLLIIIFMYIVIFWDYRSII
jgi:hypothetical protein